MVALGTTVSAKWGGKANKITLPIPETNQPNKKPQPNQPNKKKKQNTKTKTKQKISIRQNKPTKPKQTNKPKTIPNKTAHPQAGGRGQTIKVRKIEEFPGNNRFFIC